MRTIDKNNFCVKITEDNREILKNWWNTRFGHVNDKLWNLGAYYGTLGGGEYSHSNNSVGVSVITIEEFKQHILNEVSDKIIDNYDI